MSERFKLLCGVYLLLKKENEILLLRRAGTGFMDGFYSLPAGHLDSGETVTNALIRESEEEIGIKLEPKDIKLKITMHQKDSNCNCIDLFFEATNYTGEIENKEPDKCDDLRFFDINNLPENTVPYIKKAIQCFAKNDGIYLENG